MRNWLPLCFAAAMIAAPVQAQYIFLDLNGDQQCTAADFPDYEEGTIDVWLDTAHGLDGEPATCATGEDLTISAYEVVISVLDMTVTGWTNARPEFPQSLGFLKEGHKVYVGYTSSAALTHLPSGSYKLGTLSVTFDACSWGAWVVASGIFSGRGYSTGFFSQCIGLDGDYTLRLGQEFTDSCGTPYRHCNAAEDQTTWGKIKQQYLPK